MCQNERKISSFLPLPPFLLPHSPHPCSALLPIIPLSSKDKSEGDRLHQWRHQDHSRNKEQNHLQAEWGDGKGPEEDRALAQRWPSVYLRRDERYQRTIFGHGTEVGWGVGDHLRQAMAERPASLQEVFTQHSQAAVLIAWSFWSHLVAMP